MPQLQYTSASAPTRHPFALQAAKFSLYAPIAVVLLNIMMTGLRQNPQSGTESAMRAVNLSVGIISMTILLAGLILGIVALFGIKRHGPEKIMLRAIVGVSINVVLLSLFVLVLITALLIVHRPAAVKPPPPSPMSFLHKTPPH